MGRGKMAEVPNENSSQADREAFDPIVLDLSATEDYIALTNALQERIGQLEHQADGAQWDIDHGVKSRVVV